MAKASEYNSCPTLITGERHPFAENFLTLDPTVWKTVQIGVGQTISLGGVAGGSRYLNIAAGTTSGTETILQSVELFRAPCELTIHAGLSQRITGQEFHVELVEVDPETGEAISDPNFSSADLRFARNLAGVRFSNTTTVGELTGITVEGGLSAVYNTLSADTTMGVDTGSSPNFLPQRAIEIQLCSDRVAFQQNQINSLAGGRTDMRRSRIPDPNGFYAIRIRARNTGGAPASNTDFRIHALRVTDTTRLAVELASVAGTGDGQMTIPVQTQGSVTNQDNFWAQDTASNQAANATLTGSARDVGASSGATHRYSKFGAFAFSDQAGTMRLEVSNDVSTWRRATADTAVPANTPTFLSIPAVARYFRVVYVNGATATTTFLLNTHMLAS